MDLLGIDHRGDKMDRNWHAVRDFFRMKIPELKTKQHECRGDSTLGQERLYGAVLKEVIETVERQLAEVSFFSGDTSIDGIKLQYAPITNLGAEGKFMKLDNRILISGGTTSVKCHGQKNIISTNRLLVDPSSSDWAKKTVCMNGNRRACRMRRRTAQRLRPISCLYGESNEEPCSAEKRGAEKEKSWTDSEDSRWVQAPWWTSHTGFSGLCKWSDREAATGWSQIPPVYYSSGHQTNEESESRWGIQNVEIHYYGTQAIHQECYQTGISHCVKCWRTVTEFSELSWSGCSLYDICRVKNFLKFPQKERQFVHCAFYDYLASRVVSSMLKNLLFDIFEWY